MQSRPIYLIYLWLIFVIISLACSLTSNLTAHPAAKPTRPRHYVVVRPVTPTAVPGLSELSLPEPAPPPAAAPIHRPRATATPTPDNLARLFADVLRLFNEPTATPTDAPRLVMFPTPSPTPTSTATVIPTATPLPTETPTLALVMPTPPPTLAPTPLPPPVEAPPPAPTIAESTFVSPVAPPPPTPAPAVVASTFSSPVNPPAAAALAAPDDSGYDFLVGEFYNSPTTNAFLVIYVAIVDVNEIPIGDMKVVGARLDHNLTYESPLSTWHFEGYNAPGEVIKSGNVKFEPPSGMETTKWMLHLEDSNGTRLSEDVPFNTDADNKQWYFIKFKRKF